MSMKDRSVHIDPLLLTAFASSTGKVFSPSLRLSPYVPSFPTRDQISLAPPCRFCAAITATDSWPPPRNSLGHNKVTTRSPVPTNLRPLCLWTDCGWFDASSESSEAEFASEHKVCPPLKPQTVSELPLWAQIWTLLTMSLKFISFSPFNDDCHFDRWAYIFHLVHDASGVTY